MKRFLKIENNFSRHAPALRAAFDKRFHDPKETRSDRFVWDFWHVPDQYTLARTPADAFFPRATYQAFLQELGAWGRENLGCTAITPPWLSYYIEGCEQKLHSDVPHGPWAFVFSLSPRKPLFRGGETLLLRPETLDYWPQFSSQEDRELHSFVEQIPSRFNRLLVFDPRLPHGVNRVSGTMDPREARLVMHGWFTDPKPCLVGPLTAKQVAPVLDEAVELCSKTWEQMGIWHGVMSLRLHVKANGAVSECRALANTLVPMESTSASAAQIFGIAKKAFLGLRFPKAKSATAITLPMLFR